MSFLTQLGSIFTKIGRGVQVGLEIEHEAAPALNLIPGIEIVSTVVTGILAVERLFPQSGLGAQKALLVSAAAATVAPGIDPAVTQEAISQIVQAFNALQAAASATRPASPAPAG